jgi:hypothetical protein
MLSFAAGKSIGGLLPPFRLRERTTWMSLAATRKLRERRTSGSARTARVCLSVRMSVRPSFLNMHTFLFRPPDCALQPPHLQAFASVVLWRCNASSSPGSSSPALQPQPLLP